MERHEHIIKDTTTPSTSSEIYKSVNKPTPTNADTIETPPIYADVIESSFAFSSEKTKNNLDLITRFAENSFNQIKHIYFTKLKDKLAFYNLDINQESFHWKVLELVKNSLDNFIQQSISNGVVTITFNFSKNKVSCTVRDNGTGIPADKQEQLFLDSFPTNKEAGKQYFGGRGLGLFQLKEWATKEGGDINYSSSEKGSEFILSVDPHRHSYNIPEMESLTSPEQARTAMIKYYLNQLKEISKKLSQNSPALSNNSKEYIDLEEYIKGWTSLDAQNLPYPLFIFQAIILQNRFAKLEESK